MLRLLALVQKVPGVAPNQRFRLEQWAPSLHRDHGVTIDFSPFESPELSQVIYQPGQLARKARLVLRDAWRRRAAIETATEYDAVVVLREASLIGGAFVERAIRAKGVPLIFDFDDAIWQWSPGVNGLASLARMPWKVGGICALASAVTVGNEYLAEYARRFNSSVSIVRTSIQLDEYPQLPVSSNASLVLVWIGSHSTLAHLETLRPALQQLATRLSFTLRVICDVRPEPIPGVDIEYLAWRAESEAQDLAAGHVGLMPLPDTPFTRGKCGCKALQYMAIGRPAVVSPVGINREIVRDGENGLWATSTDEWVQQIERLASDRALLLRLGAAARETVVSEGYSARSSAAAFAAVVKRVVGAGRAMRDRAVS